MLDVTFEMIIVLSVLVGTTIYHILIDYFQKKKAVNIQSDTYTIEDRLKEFNSLLLKNLQYLETLEKQITTVVEKAVLECSFSEKEKEAVLESILAFQKEQITASGVYANAQKLYSELETAKPTNQTNNSVISNPATNALRRLLKGHRTS